MKTVLLGDIGGQLGVLQSMLTRLGIGEDLLVPEGITVIQVGDVVRMNDSPQLDSLGCAMLVDSLMRKNPERWIQFLGNHEAPFIGGSCPPSWEGKEALSSCRDIVESWWAERLVKLAALFTMPDGSECVLTHAGVTHGYMELSGQNNASGIVQHINEIIGHDYGSVSQTGIIGFGAAPNLQADFLWASSGRELISSWANEDMGFHQIHGHDTPLISWEQPSLRSELPRDWTIDIDARQRLTVVSTPHGWTFKTNDWVLKEFGHANIAEWGLIELPMVPTFGLESSSSSPQSPSLTEGVLIP